MQQKINNEKTLIFKNALNSQYRKKKFEKTMLLYLKQ